MTRLRQPHVVVLVAALAAGAAGSTTRLHAQDTNPGTIRGFNPQPDPPGFGLISIVEGQAIRLYVTCFDHPIGGTPPDPCRGRLMFHNATGGLLTEGTYDLLPGKSTFLQFMLTRLPDEGPLGRIGIIPCVLPSPEGGVGVPAVQIMDLETGHVSLRVTPAASHIRELSTRFLAPGTIAGFNPQPDPPGFGLVALNPGETGQLNLACYEHGLGLHPPDPCRGELMIHGADGEVIERKLVDLQPGDTLSIQVTAPRDALRAIQIDPCWIPASRSGPALPSVEVFEGEAGATTAFVNPSMTRVGG